MLSTKTTASNPAWNLDLRVRVGDGVTHNSTDWINATGKNTEPGANSFDWKPVSSESTESRPIVMVNGRKFFLDKHPNNSDLLNASIVEQNDMIHDGWWSTTEYWTLARFIGADKDVKADWQILGSIEEIPII